LVGNHAFFIAGRHASALLTPIDEPLDAGTQAGAGVMERPLRTGILLAQDRDPDIMWGSVLAHLPTAVPLIAHRALVGVWGGLAHGA
jgi:hypothetical protein